MPRRHALCALFLLGCPGNEEGTAPVFRVLTGSVLTFEGAPGAVVLETEVRARFSVLDGEGEPRGAAVAQAPGRLEVPFDTAGLPAETTLRLVGVSDSGGRAEATVTAQHSAQAPQSALAEPAHEILDAALLSDGRVVAVAADGVFLQQEVDSTTFEGPLPSSTGRTTVAAGNAGDFFVAGEDDVLIHFDDRGEDCDRIDLPPTQIEGGEGASTGAVDIATQFGAGDTEVAVAHDLGFSGLGFSNLACADSCAVHGACDLFGSSAFSTGSCITSSAVPDFRATAVAMDGDRIYTGGYTFSLWSIADGRNQCIDLGMGEASSRTLSAISISAGRVWVAIGDQGEPGPPGSSGIFSLARDFDSGPPAPRPDARTDLPDGDLIALDPLTDGGDTGVWFGAASGAGRLRETVDWISASSLPGRRVTAILQSTEQPEIVWLATDHGLVRLVLPGA